MITGPVRDLLVDPERGYEQLLICICHDVREIRQRWTNDSRIQTPQITLTASYVARALRVQNKKSSSRCR